LPFLTNKKEEKKERENFLENFFLTFQYACGGNA